jgi:dephospho-CoA kinase
MSKENRPPYGRGFLVLGLTGGIASGKSTFAKILEALGAPVVDADRVARSLTEPGGAAHETVRARFGTTDRARLRELVFADPGARKELEALLHPLIARESEALLREAATRSRRVPPVVIYEATLLVETGRYRDLDGLILVEAPRELRVERLLRRDSIARPLAEAIVSAQLSDEERRSRLSAEEAKRLFIVPTARASAPESVPSPKGGLDASEEAELRAQALAILDQVSQAAAETVGEDPATGG